ncbi:hypothetical protein ASPWEDRAFT_537115 [Aspergillus wentii DTO 134E9]|uniref:AMP-dependent synthetase/ligase domain-containing protein n=1 Tax=Aspergillus wentii DTO 134E9 TaxID=1073089 RepID=A0A1L9RMY1_ASPWE|nr:uncharacterized protein ASPWEDRAFT_537115 [Aspergillus wentii DTO 134E9]KAI9929381.1 hypothetical protein MW887_000850 [Aspergillus wentii]OJJ36178.1 hypothetical protein ASPWEDRAFT_537115 [Aspergillus wentii DTO 134E9]
MAQYTASLSILHGPSEPALKPYTIARVLHDQANAFPTREAVIFPASGTRYTYDELNTRTKTVARALIANGIQAGDRVGIFAGNCEQYAEVFLAATRIGAITVLLNIAYSAKECLNVLKTTGCSLFFTSTHIGERCLTPCLLSVSTSMDDGVLPDLQQAILLHSGGPCMHNFSSYESFIALASRIPEASLCEREKKVQSEDTCTFQFTSGTTGAPKIAMLTHNNVINNGHLIGHRLLLTEQDVICCPYPLFHISGLVMGLLSCLTHGATVVYPSPTFNPTAVLRTVVEEKCTGLHGVPTIFIALLEEYRKIDIGQIHVRTGLIGGAPIPAVLVKEMQREFGFEDLTVAYGMTETSPIAYMSRASDQPEEGAVIHTALLPHTSARVVDSSGNIVPRGTRGEMTIAGNSVQKGYYNNPEKTSEALKEDASGIVWMYTGDEAVMDSDGNCMITGRIKDIIIRGAENIYPAEIEERLNEHPAISQSCIVGVKSERLGEEAAAFLQLAPEKSRPSDQEVIKWVQMNLAPHKAPRWIFWLGHDDVPVAFPITDSGKIKRNEVTEIGHRLIYGFS